MADTYTLISSVTVGAGGASSIDFTSIPSTYTDLCLKISVRTTNGAYYDALFSNYNGNTSANFSSIRIQGNGTSASSGSSTGNTELVLNNSAVGDTATASTFNNAELYIPNYAGSNYKSSSYDGVGENNATSAIAVLNAGLWSNTSAINRITLTCGGSFKQYSTAYLYGISNS